MAMGSTGTINVSTEMLQNAINAIEDYRQEANTLYTDVANIVSDLIPGNFSGSAATDFKGFYDTKVEPALGQSLTELLDGMVSMLEGIKGAIPAEEGVDEALAQANQNAGN